MRRFASAMLLCLFVATTFSACDELGLRDDDDDDNVGAVAPLPNNEMSPFVEDVVISTAMLEDLEAVSYSIETKPGNFSAPIHVTYSAEYLDDQGRIDRDSGTVRVTVFGLYADYDNAVLVKMHFEDGVESEENLVIPTGVFESEAGLPEVTVHQIDEQPPVSFMIVRSSPRSPIILDADGETRWIAPDVGESVRATFFDGDAFFVGATKTDALYRIEWDGSFEVYQIGDGNYTRSHHNLELGKEGLLNTIGFDDGVIVQPQSLLIEIDGTGEVLREWSMDSILTDFIVSNGEDESDLVQNGFDWFHMNSAIYDAANDSVIMSSREEFVISVDYLTKEIEWILGNPAKLWYTGFPDSLRKLALDVTGVPPIGQHALSISEDGRRLMLFNNGAGNFNLPDVGDSLDYSLVSIFEIDPEKGTADAVWEFDYDQEIFSDICSSAYRTRSGDVLILYASAEERQLGRILVVNDDEETLYEASIPKREVDRVSCVTTYSIDEIPLDDLTIE